MTAGIGIRLAPTVLTRVSSTSMYATRMFMHLCYLQKPVAMRFALGVLACHRYLECKAKRTFLGKPEGDGDLRLAPPRLLRSAMKPFRPANVLSLSCPSRGSGGPANGRASAAAKSWAAPASSASRSDSCAYQFGYSEQQRFC